MKLVNPGAEIRVLKTICDGHPKLASRILTSVGDNSFYHEPAKEAWFRLRALLKSHGEIPSWADLCADPAVSEANRSILVKDPQKPMRIAAEDKVNSTLRTIERYRQLRGLLEMAQEVIDTVEDEQADIEKLMDVAGEHLLNVRTNANAKARLLHFGRGNNTTQLMKQLLNGKNATVVPTGYKAFDSVNGGILLGSLFVLAANTGGGKSTMAINLAHNMTLASEDVCIVPLEMTAEQMTARLVGLRAELDVGKVSAHKLARGEKKKAVGSYKDYVGDLKKKDTRLTVFEPEEDMSIEEILMMLKPYKYRVIIIDYISLLRGADDDDQAKKLGAIARFAKVFAKNNNCIVVLLAQLDDQTKNIRYARAIREHANNAWFWFVSPEEADESILDIRQMKARNQKRFNFELLSYNKTMLITDVDEAHREQAQNTDRKAKLDKHFKDLEDDAEDDEDEDEGGEE